MRSLIRNLRRRHHVAAAYVALFFALGGSAYAVANVTSASIVDGTIQAVDIGDGQVPSAKIEDGTVQAADLADGQVTSAKVASDAIQSSHIAPHQVGTYDLALGSVTWGILAPDAVSSSRITNGSIQDDDIGFAQVTSYQIADGTITGADLGDVLQIQRVSAVSAGGSGSSKTATASCPSGFQALGGGGEILDDANDYMEPDNLTSIVASKPTTAGTGWFVEAETIDFPAIPKFTFAYDDGYVTGFASYIVEDKQTFNYPWKVKAWAVCARV